MENENTNNNIDLTPIVEGLQTLNQGTNSNGEKLDEIMEYLITKDKLEQEEKEKAAKEQEEKEKAAKDQEEKDQQEAEIKSAQEEQDQETFEEVITNIRDQVVLTNNLLSGQIFFMGVVFGVLMLKILWDRFIR